MQQIQELIYPGLLDLSSLSTVPVNKDIDLVRMAETKAETRQLQNSKRNSQQVKQQVLRQ